MLPKESVAAVPAATRRFDTQSDHRGPTVHSSGQYPAYCLNHGAASPNGRVLSRGVKLPRTAGSLGRAISIALDLGPTTTSGGTTINGVSLSNLEWRMAVQLAVFRLQGEQLAYSTSTNHWRASTWIMNRALDANSVQHNRYWRYEPPAGSGVQTMVLSLGDPLTARVHVRKVDNEGGVLSGAVFGMWTSSTAANRGDVRDPSFIDRSTSNSSGSAWWYRIPVGRTYYIRELSPPPGYVLNPRVVSIRPTSGEDSEVRDSELPSFLAGTIENTPEARGRIELQKRSVSSGDYVPSTSIQGNSAYSLAGAAYGIWTTRAAADARNQSHSSYVGRMMTDARGVASYDELRAGAYFVRELTPPPGHILDGTIYQVNIVATGTTTPSIVRVNSSDERRYGTGLRIQKLDRESGQAVAAAGASLAGAEFEVRWADPSASDGWRVQSLVTDARGQAEYRATGASRPGIPIGNFQIREVRASEGYLIDPEFSNWRTYTVLDSGGADRPLEISLASINPQVSQPLIRGDIAIRKYGGEVADLITPLAGIRFHIIDNTPTNKDGMTNPRYGHTVATLNTDQEGYARSRDLIPDQSQWGGKDFTSGLLEYGSYLLREDPSSLPFGLEAIKDMPFSIQDNGVEMNYHLFNQEARAALTVGKRDAETGKVIPITGTQFQILDKDMQVISFTVTYPHTTTVSTFTTDETGQINIPETLKLGDYYLREVQAPNGYLLLDAPFGFRVDRSFDWTEPFVVSIDNYPAMGRVRIVKSDSVTATAVADTVFELRAKDDIVTGEGSVRLRAGELADVLRTDAEGIAESIALYLGDYELREVETSPWYLLNQQVFTVELRYLDQLTALSWTEVEVQNEPVAVSCEVSKRTIDLTSAGYRSLSGDSAIDNTAAGSKERYRYDVDFRSTSNDWADEYVVIDYLEGVHAGQIRVDELWTPVVAGDSNGLYNLWYQTNLSDETSTYADTFAASKDEINPANPNQEMRFGNQGWKLWLEDADSSERQRLSVDDLDLEEEEFITLIKLEYGRVEKGFTSNNKGKWKVPKDAASYNSEIAGKEGLAPLSYLVYCPEPLDKFDPFTGEDTIIHNSASSHITRNINLFDDDMDTVETRLVDSFIFEDETELPEGESSSERTSDLSRDPGEKDNSDDSKEPAKSGQPPETGKDSPSSSVEEGTRSPGPHLPKTEDMLNRGMWLASTVTAACIAMALLRELSSRKRRCKKS